MQNGQTPSSGDLFGGRSAACLALFAITGHYALRGFCFTPAGVTRIGRLANSQSVKRPVNISHAAALLLRQVVEVLPRKNENATCNWPTGARSRRVRSKAIPSDEKHFTADGVVAVQKTKDEARIYDPHSMGDLVEVWMVRVDKWTRSERPTFILVEYAHRDPILKDSELDRTEWRFNIRPAPPAKSETCMSWWTRTFIPTALGANQKLPPPKELGGFLIRSVR